jgi:hypothetical protein
MIVVVEGPDGSGKSTLIEQLGLKRQHVLALQGWREPGETTHQAYCRRLAHAEDETGFDRFHLSERVYDVTLRAGRNHELVATFPHIVRSVRAMGVPVILCLPPLATCMNNVLREGRERPPYQTVPWLREAYYFFWRLQDQATVVYDYTTQQPPTREFLSKSLAD